MQHEKSPTREKVQHKNVQHKKKQHEKSAIRKKGDMKIVSHEMSAI